MEIDYSSQSTINKMLWDICQDFREETDIKTDYINYISALLYIVFYKSYYLDILYDMRKDYYIADKIDSYLEEIKLKNKSLFRRVCFKNIKIYRSLGEENILSKTVGNLYKLIKKVEKNNDDAKYLIGEAYRKALIDAMFNKDISFRSGEAYTPRGIAKLINRITITNEKGLVYDPFCGCGNLLLNVPTNGNIEVCGEEENGNLYDICMTNLFLHDVKNDKIKLSEYSPNFEKEQYDYVISNPPFMEKKLKPREVYMQRLNQKYGEIENGVGDYSYVMMMYNSLKPGGKMAVILPHGVLFRENERNSREILLKENCIDAIIGLPENLFIGTRNSVIIMVLKKDRTDKDVLFIDASQEYKSIRRANVMSQENQNKVQAAYFARKNIDEFASVVSKKEIENNNYNLTIKKYVIKKRPEIKVDKRKIVENIQKLERENGILEDNIKDVLEKLEIKDAFVTYKQPRELGEVDYEKIGEKLAAARVKAGIPLFKMAEDLNMMGGIIVRLERGVGKVSLDTIVKICNYLNVSIDKIIND